MFMASLNKKLYVNSDSSGLFIGLNLPYSKGTLRRNETITVNQFQYPKAKHHREHQGVRKTKVGMPWCTGRF